MVGESSNHKQAVVLGILTIMVLDLHWVALLLLVLLLLLCHCFFYAHVYTSAHAVPMCASRVGACDL